MVRHIILDVDGTLYRSGSVTAHLIQSYSKETGKSPKELADHYRYSVETLIMSGQKFRNVRKFWNRVNELFLDQLNQTENSELLSHLTETSRKEILLDSLKLNTELTTFLQKCKLSGLNRYVLAGTFKFPDMILNCEVDRKRLSFVKNQIKKLGIYDLIDQVYVTEQFGGYKPQSVVFERFTKKINSNPDDCVIIGDSEADMFAKKLGWKTIMMGEKSSELADYETTSFCEIERILFSELIK